jgi:type II secretory pathway component HofQ
MKTEQATRMKPIAQGRLITLSQWDGSAFLPPEQRGLPATERGGGRAITEVSDTEGTAPATT